MKELRIHPATVIFLVILFITGFSSVIFPYIVAVTLHELGHAYVAKKCGYRLNKIWVLPFGACISFKEFSFDPKDEIKIAFAGPVVNLILIILTMACWWIFPISYAYTYTFAITNFSIAIFNLLPVFPLDGGRILTGMLRINIKPKKVFKFACLINYIFSLLFFVLFIVSIFISINFSFILISIFLFVGTFEGKFQGKYSPILYQKSKRRKSKPISVKNFCVQSYTPFYKVIPEINSNKFNMIYVQYPSERIRVITESQFQKILEKNSLEKCFDDLEKTLNK